MLTGQIRPVTCLPILMCQETAAIALPPAVCRSLLSVSSPSSPSCPVRKERPRGKPAERTQLPEASRSGLPEFTLTQWIVRNPTSSQLRDSGKEQQGGDGQWWAVNNCEKIWSTGVEQLFSTAPVDVGATSSLQLSDWALASSFFYCSLYLLSQQNIVFVTCPIMTAYSNQWS